jgi:hypothetical protein
MITQWLPSVGEYEVYRVQQKVKKQQLSLMDNWRNELYYILNEIQ